MPCYDPRDSPYFYQNEVKDKDELIGKHEDYITQLEAMLCALSQEALHVEDDFGRDVLKNAYVNGKCPDIKKWFHFHKIKDVTRLVKNGLPDKPSIHELQIWKYINPSKKKGNQ